MLDAGVVDEDVHRSHLGFSVGDHHLDLGSVGHVRAMVESLDAELFLDFDPLRLDRRLVAKSVKDGARPSLGEGAGDGQADAACRAGDKGMTLGERHRRFSSSDPRGETVRVRAVILHCGEAFEGFVALQTPWMTNSRGAPKTLRG